MLDQIPKCDVFGTSTSTQEWFKKQALGCWFAQCSYNCSWPASMKVPTRTSICFLEVQVRSEPIRSKYIDVCTRLLRLTGILKLFRMLFWNEPDANSRRTSVFPLAHNVNENSRNARGCRLERNQALATLLPPLMLWFPRRNHHPVREPAFSHSYTAPSSQCLWIGRMSSLVQCCIELFWFVPTTV